MRLALRVLTATAVLAASTLAAYADTYQYAFTFCGIINASPISPMPTTCMSSVNNPLSTPDFSLTIDEPNLISTTSFGPLPTPLATPLGYSVVNFGEDAEGDFLFSNSGGAFFDGGVEFSLTTFLFKGDGNFAGLGTQTSTIEGNDPSLFFGVGSLTVTDLTPAATTPEPSSFMLLGTGILGFAGAARRKFIR
jgi:hypothetical protein